MDCGDRIYNTYTKWCSRIAEAIMYAVSGYKTKLFRKFLNESLKSNANQIVIEMDKEEKLEGSN